MFHAVDVFQGLKPGGWLLVNTNKDLAELGIGSVVARLPPGHAVRVPASEIAMRRIGRPLPNAALLGAFAALGGQVRIGAVEEAIREALAGPVGEANAAAAREAYAAALQQEGAAC